MADARRCADCGSAVPLGRSGEVCSSWCEGRRAQGLPAQPPPPLRPVTAVPAPSSPGRSARSSLAERVATALDGARVGESWQAAQALDLAERIEDGSAKGTALAALHRELRAVMGDALRGTDQAVSKVGRYRDQLAERRARREAGGEA